MPNTPTQMLREIAEIPVVAERQIRDGGAIYRAEGERLRFAAEQAGDCVAEARAGHDAALAALNESDARLAAITDRLGAARQAQAAVVQKKSVQFRGWLNAAGILRQRALPIGIQGIAPQRVSQSCGVHPYLMARATAYAAGSQGQPLRRKRERDCRIGRSAEKQPQFLGIHCIGMPDM